MRRRGGGFTLIELMVSLAIFAVVSVIAYGGLRLLIDNRVLVESSADRLDAVQRAISMFDRDLQQAAPRSIRDPFGDQRATMLSDDLAALEWTRAGRPNPLGAVRSELQRLGYRVEDGQLIRMSWQVLDQSQDPPVREEAVLDLVEEISLRFLGEDEEWVEVWPPAGVAPQMAPLPRAVEVTLLLDDLGEIRRLVQMPPDPMAMQP
ncbi:type II secretion system minor pseudopilin GspJ [Methylonatrum kenyense]|uniref:type II secretion system minor pseudopilin GspJ n=1 Tax=Methylonatrum kenyense TaxID=455253 RepID=UPI0020BE5C03|nr:type II secretion system minor pseudopilin GspJ [Methylonatrum kenyense]MCK8517028.1 type II secretion system minor pseudopilin GspJ [Methylonatrum kenyense]